jgi:hypothetical protein
MAVRRCGSGRRNPGLAAWVPDAERGHASIAVTAPDTAGLGGPQPVANTTAPPAQPLVISRTLLLDIRGGGYKTSQNLEPLASFRTALVATAASALSLAATPAALANGLSFTNYTTAQGLANNNVRGVYASGSNIYAATAGGLSISTNGASSFTNYTTTSGLGSDFVQGVYASGSNIYAATQGGLSISTNGGSSFTNRTTTSGLGATTC